MAKKVQTAWIKHVMSVKRANPKWILKKVLVQASKTYHPGKKRR